MARDDAKYNDIAIGTALGTIGGGLSGKGLKGTLLAGLLGGGMQGLGGALADDDAGMMAKGAIGGGLMGAAGGPLLRFLAKKGARGIPANLGKSSLKAALAGGALGAGLEGATQGTIGELAKWLAKNDN